MKKGNWVPMDKALLAALPKRRPYSLIEAVFSIQADMDNGKLKGEREYSRIFTWSRSKTRNLLRTSKCTTDRATKRPVKFRFIEKIRPDQNREPYQQEDQEKTTTYHPSSLSSSNPQEKKDKGANRDKHDAAPHSPLSFEAWTNLPKKDGPFSPLPDVIEAMNYFLQEYEKQKEETHPRLLPDQWDMIAFSMSSVFDPDTDRTVAYCPSFDEWKMLIDTYFTKTYQDGCDYRIMHFTSSGVLKNLYYETLY